MSSATRIANNAATSAASSAASTAVSAAVANKAEKRQGDEAPPAPAAAPAEPQSVLPQLQDGPVTSSTGALEPIAGVTLERYAELAAKMADCNNDLELCAQVAEREGLDRATWQTVMDGWNERMNNPDTAGEVALAYMPLYQAALAQHGGPRATATEDEYLEMLCMINTDLKEGDCRPVPFEPMYERYRINAPKWSQISTDWVDYLTKNPEAGAAFGERAAARIKELDDLWLSTHTLPWS